MRTIRINAVGNGVPFTAIYTLTYEAPLNGETVQFAHTLIADGIESLGDKLARFPEDSAVRNIAVRDWRGEDVTFSFRCFRAEPPEYSPTGQRMALELLTAIPTPA